MQRRRDAGAADRRLFDPLGAGHDTRSGGNPRPGAPIDVYKRQERPSRLRSVTKEVYWETAELHGCNRSDVERNIRTVIHHAWKVNRPGLQALSEYPLLAPPSVSDFLQIMVSHLKKAMLPIQGTNVG